MTHIIQIDDEVREATREEAAAIDAQRDAIAAAAKEAENKAKLRAAALAKLGLTADETAALFG
jgi:hypothetical protein